MGSTFIVFLRFNSGQRTHIARTSNEATQKYKISQLASFWKKNVKSQLVYRNLF